jgi:hypothetical protein
MADCPRGFLAREVDNSLAPQSGDRRPALDE